MNQFQCCICGRNNSEINQAHRELMLCAQCGSNARFRGLMLGVMRYAFNEESKPLIKQSDRRSITAIGISDSEIYAWPLAAKLSYANTYYHTEPQLDICDLRSIDQYSNIDLIICSDVIEHTPLAPRKVLENMRRMLRPGGILILSAPTYHLPETIEWYPDAASLEVKDCGGRHEVRWSDTSGAKHVDFRPCFHGGPGSTLEMRLIAHQDLIQAGMDAGFEVETLEFSPEIGYVWPIVPEYPGIAAPMDGRVLVLRRPHETPVKGRGYPR
ncbi:class I SAM-dependent methyltransferase [Burkholderia sp. ABCPW 14]|uniref:class I SAM-dependent methyltransferase n=1 Tax=Burkholderia sp. ABCPW 14 TaxID=1637860 RepID=UPI000B0228BB|nr:class I SAM-dependent methyltransferase [Burkholderia sp. ABCPW 14]